MPLNLLIVDQDRKSRWYELPDGVTKVGRGSDNDLVLVGRGVSRHHAAFVLDVGTLTVQDLDSTYGTRVNGRMIRKKSVELGDPIDIGVFRVIPLPAKMPVGRVRQQDSVPVGMDRVPLDTAEYTLPQGLGQRILMDVQPSGLDDFGPEETSGLQALPPGVQIVDGWGQEALARVLRRGRDQATMDWEGQALDMLQVLAKNAASRTDAARVLSEALDTLVQLVRCEVAVFLEMVDQVEYRPLAFWQREKETEIPLSRTVINKAVRESTAVLSENLAADPEFRAMDSVHIRKVGALLALPLVVEGDVVGVLYLSRKAGVTFSDEEIQLAEVVAAVAAGVLRAKRLSKLLRTRQRQGLALEKVVDPVVRRSLVERPVPRFLDRSEATILVVRLAIDMASGVAEDDVAACLSNVFGLVSEVATRNGGVLVTVEADRIIIGFGLDSPARTDAMWAVTCAFEILSQMAVVLDARGDVDLSVGLGLATGPVLWGVLDFPGRAVQVVLGDVVDEAEELAAMDQPLAVVASQDTVSRITSSAFDAVPVGSADGRRAFRLLVR